MCIASTRFDIVFGYGFGDGPMHPATAVRLPVHVARYLTNSIEELGWSQNKIMDPQFRRVLNVLFGFGVNSGAPKLIFVLFVVIPKSPVA